MPQPTVTVSLPVADRAAARDFYRDAFGFEAHGPLADDGVPEPLRFALGDGAELLLIPTDGFRAVATPNAVATPGTSEVLLSIALGAPEEVGAAVARAEAAGATVVAPTEDKGWACVATVADPDGHLWVLASYPS